MAISNSQLLTQKEPDKYKYYSDKEKQAAMQFEGWDRRDLDEYIHNKLKYEVLNDPSNTAHSQYLNSYGKESMSDFVSQNQALRDKYGMASDNWSYNDLGRLGADIIYGDFIDYGLNNEKHKGTATKLAENWYDSLLPDDEYYDYGRGGGGGSGSGGGGGRTQPSFTMPPMPQMRSGRSMAELLGIDYNLQNIEKRYTDAVDKKYANLDTEYGRTQDLFYDNVANSADILMGALRRGDRDAVRSGTAQGTQASQELTALLGASQEASQGATELAQGRADLVHDRESEMAKVMVEALKYYNDLGINLGQLSASELNALTQAYAAQVAGLAGVYNTDVLANVEWDRIASQERIAEADRVSRENIATWGNTNALELQELVGLTAVEVENIRKEYNTAIAQIQADTTLSAKDKDIEITKINGQYNARIEAMRNSNKGNTSGATDENVEARLQQLFAVIGSGAASPEAVEATWREVEKILGYDLGYGGIIKPTTPAPGTSGPSDVPLLQNMTEAEYDAETEKIINNMDRYTGWQGDAQAIRQKRNENKKNYRFK